MSTFALVVGVGKYRVLDAGGREDLWGAENDARAWAEWLTQVFGVDQLRVLSTADAGAAPTGQALLAGVTWLAEQMRAARAAGRPASGLVTFSGHGAALPDLGTVGSGLAMTLALCPSDVRREVDGTVAGVVLVADVLSALGDVADDVTFCLDACYTTGAGPLRAVSPTTPVPTATVTAGRMLLACEPWAAAYELTAGGQRRGAFTVALQTLLEQWTLREDAGGRCVNVTGLDLVNRTRDLLGVLGVKQTPLWVGTARLGLVPFLRSGSALAMGATSQDPDQTRHGSQLDAGTTGGYRHYILQSAGAAVVAHVIVTRTAHTGAGGKSWGASKEYWYLNQMVGTPSAPLTVKLQKDGAAWPASGTSPTWTFLDDPCALGAMDASWTGVPSGGVTITAHATAYCQGSSSDAPGGLAISYAPATAPRQMTHLWWFNAVNSTTRFFGGMAEGASLSFTAGTAPTSGYYYDQKLTVT